MAVTQYIGARYVPILAEPVEWDANREYEPLTIVTYQGASYTSKQSVPRDVPITNEQYWVLTGNYNAQFENLRQTVIRFDGRITANENGVAENAADIADETAARTAADTAETEARTAADTALDAAITAETAAREAADTALETRLNDTIDNEVTPLKHRGMKGQRVICIGDSYGANRGSDQLGWAKYLNDYNEFDYFLNVSNPGAGFVDTGNGSVPELVGLTFNGQVDYAYNHLADGTGATVTAEDITLVIIAGGYNDWNEEGVYTAARQCVENARTKFPNARIDFYPLLVGDVYQDGDSNYHGVGGTMMNRYMNMAEGAAHAGAQVSTDSMWWLFPETNATASGDHVHPNNTGYSRIAEYISGTALGGNWAANTYTWGTSAEGFSISTAEGASSTPYNGGGGFRCGVQNGMAWFKGAVKRDGTGQLCRLPTYLRPGNTQYFLAFYYGSDCHGVARIRLTADGYLNFYNTESEIGNYSSSSEYTVYLPFTVFPLGGF